MLLVVIIGKRSMVPQLQWKSYQRGRTELEKWLKDNNNHFENKIGSNL